jgi:predicted DNA-binding transcriptional regulator AlpA
VANAGTQETFLQTLLTVKEAAARTGLSVSTLNKIRMRFDGPRFIRIGRRRVAYRPEDLDAWLASNTHQSTSEYVRPKKQA